MNNEEPKTTEMKQTAVEWFANQAYELFEQYSEGNFDRITLNKFMLQATEQAKEMEEQQKKDAWEDGMRSDNGFFGTFEQYYNKIYGGNK
jgi:hypothetical protein